MAFGGRQFEVTQAGNPRHLQLRTSHEIWHKENALNLLIQRLPAEAKYVAWIDADVKFSRPDWAQETLQLLQHYDVLQMFSHAQDVGPNYEPLTTTPGFLYKWVTDQPSPHEPKFMAQKPAYGYYSVHSGQFWHPGFAWAAKRSALESVGMLIDHAILGAGRLAHGVGAGGAGTSLFVLGILDGIHPVVPGMARAGGEIYPAECGLLAGTGEPSFSRSETESILRSALEVSRAIGI